MKFLLEITAVLCSCFYVGCADRTTSLHNAIASGGGNIVASIQVEARENIFQSDDAFVQFVQTNLLPRQNTFHMYRSSIRALWLNPRRELWQNEGSERAMLVVFGTSAYDEGCIAISFADKASDCSETATNDLRLVYSRSDQILK